jgi:predicted amidohydrolase YtcJ
MTPAQPHAEAVAIAKDRILKVGTNTEITSLIGKDTKILDLKGKTVVPGFIDTHIHVADFGRTLAWIDLKGADSIQALQTLVKEKTAKTARDKWVLGSGWNQDNFKEKRIPTRHDLDAAAPDNPVILYHQLGRTGVTNGKGLELAGVTKETVAPKDGAIEKDPETSEPTGILQGTATDLIWRVVPAPTEQETMEGAQEACRKIVASGITSVHWIVASVAELRIAQKLSLENSVSLRIFIIATADVFENLPISEETDLKIGGGLIFADGYLASQSAALNEPYAEPPANRGQLMYTQEELNRLAAKIHRAKLQVIIHAMGDKAVNVAFKALESISTGKPLNKNRHRLEQAALLNRQLIEHIRKLGIVVSIQPKVVESEFTVWSATEHLGKKRARMLFPLKTLLTKGVCVVGGSDCPMEPLSPLLGVQSVVARKQFPEERLTIEEALRLYTVNAAYATQEETEKGVIEQGKLTDLTVLSEDPTKSPPGKLADVEVELTIIGGRIVHQKR